MKNPFRALAFLIPAFLIAQGFAFAAQAPKQEVQQQTQSQSQAQVPQPQVQGQVQGQVQTPVVQPPAQPQAQTPGQAPGQPQTLGLRIGPGDTIFVQIMDTPELNQHPKVTDSGDVPITGVGNVQVAGLTPGDAAALIREKLISAHYMNHPDVTVTIEEYATQTVSVIGQVKLPGAYPVLTSRSILDVIALAGGLLETADFNITIRRKDPSQPPVTYNLDNDAKKAIAGSVEVYPGDTVIVPKAGIAYILGDVRKPGGFVMQNNHSQLTVIQAVALAGGTSPSAVPSHAKLMRRNGDGKDGYQEIAINFSAMQKGKQADMVMQPDDIVYIPFSYFRNIVSNGAGIVASTSSAALYAIP
jgi:polysaccharide biosynthesis/export protein